MLKKVYIKNFALFDEIEVEFTDHLNIITGETGAGKSLLIEALKAILGEKIDPESLRNKDSKAIVEGIFSAPSSNQLKDLVDRENVNLAQPEIILRRELHPSGHSRSFLNDSPVTMDILSQVGDALVELHGQHEHQSLLKTENHLHFLDSFGGLDQLLNQTKEKYEKVKSLSYKLKRLREEERELKKRRDYLKFQLQEITRVNPQPEEDQKLKHRREILQNSEELSQVTQFANHSLYEEENSVYSTLSEIINKLGQIAATDETFGRIREECSHIQIKIEEIARELRSYHQNIEFSSQELDEINQRLAVINRLKEKHGKSLTEVLEYKKQIEAKLEEMDSLSNKIVDLEGKLAEAKKKFANQAIKLSRKRQKAAKKLERQVVEVLSELGMEKARFEVRMRREKSEEGLVEIDGDKFKGDQTGIDKVEFYLSANPGEEPKPLIKVASGGEISRIMLALKSILAGRDQIPTLFFDEIDRGVSGPVAHAVGERLANLAQSHQTICITHLPQIACQGDYHLLVVKKATDQKTQVSVRPLDGAGRVAEIAKLIGGETITETNRKSAQELLRRSVSR